MNPILKYMACICLMASFTWSCNNSPKTAGTGQAEPGQTQPAAEANPSEYQDFSMKFKEHPLPYAMPGDVKEEKSGELDKKFIRDMLMTDFTPAFGKEDILPRISDDIDASKYYADARLKLDSFDAFVIHKQADDDYYFLCIFDKHGKFTDGTWIAFTEGSEDDGTVRQASVNDDKSIEISQYNVIKGKTEPGSTEHRFYEITVQGKIRDMKDNATPADA